MTNLSRWEEVRIFSYIFFSLALVFAIMGIHFDAAGFGAEKELVDIIELLSDVLIGTSQVCGFMGSILLAVSEGWKRSLSSEEDTSSIILEFDDDSSLENLLEEIEEQTND